MKEVGFQSASAARISECLRQMRLTGTGRANKNQILVGIDRNPASGCSPASLNPQVPCRTDCQSRNRQRFSTSFAADDWCAGLSGLSSVPSCPADIQLVDFTEKGLSRPGILP